jgi:hypothetical protein
LQHRPSLAEQPLPTLRPQASLLLILLPSFVFLQQVYHDGIDHSVGAGVATNAAVLHQLRSFHSSQLLPPLLEHLASFQVQVPKKQLSVLCHQWKF